MQRFLKAIVAIMLMTAVCFAAGCTKPDEPNNGGNGGNSGSGTYNGHEYVDLGLPNGTLWATCNVGATTPEDYGDYFAWGETNPKSDYNWDTYMFCKGAGNQLTKYCNNEDYGYNGFTDNLNKLLPDNDAATTNWGSGWQMPTLEQWKELCQNTTSAWTIQNNVGGCLFSASNGRNLFIPAAGGYWGMESSFVGYGCLYGSSSLYSNPDCAWGFNYNSEAGYDVSSLYRCGGLSIRAVRSVHQK